MTDALLDVNVLLAVAWPNHQFHAAARAWLTAHEARWCTCAVTQLGFVRLSSNPAFTDQATTPHEASRLLEAMCHHSHHRFVTEMPSLGDPSFSQLVSRMLGHRQVTDGYLLAVARHHGLQLVTFDRRLEALAVRQESVALIRA